MTGLPVRRIVVLKPGPIGDFLHSVPAVAALRESFPESRITVITGPENADLVEAHPAVDERIYIPGHLFRGDPLGLVRFIRQVRALRSDLFVDLKSNARSFLVGILSGAGRVLRYRKQRPEGAGRRRLHAIENLLETVIPVTGAVPEPAFGVHLRKEDEQAADEYLRSLAGGGTGAAATSVPLVAFNPNVSIPESSRHWPPGYFARLGDRVAAELGAAVVLIGGPGDRAYCDSIAAAMARKPAVSAGALTLGQTGALLRRCRVLVTGDTGPMHLAAAVGTKTIALFGSMDHRRAGPYGEGHVVIRKELWCAPCEKRICPLGTTQCMKDITVDEVFEAVAIAVGGKTGPSGPAPGAVIPGLAGSGDRRPAGRNGKDR